MKEIKLLSSFRENQFLGRLIRSPGSLRRRKGSEALEKEKWIWGSHGEKNGFVLVNKTMYLAPGHVSP